MFNKRDEIYIPKHLDLISECTKVKFGDNKFCLPAGYVTQALKSTFQFIMNHPYRVGDRLANVYITLSVAVLKDQSSTNINFNYAVTTINGVVKKVCETYVILECINNLGEIIKCTISYDDMLYIYHVSILENFVEYVYAINSLPPICHNPDDEKFNLLTKISKVLSKDYSKKRNLTFLLDGVLTRDFEASSIAILRNLILLEERFILPITSISGFLQNAPA